MSRRLVLIGRHDLTGLAANLGDGIFADKIAWRAESLRIGESNFFKLTIPLAKITTADERALRSALIAHKPELAGYALLQADVQKISMAFFDTDSTFIDQEVIDEIADFANVKNKVAAITERAMRGELDFDAALKERVALLKDVPADALATISRTRLTITQGVREFVAALHERQAKTYLVSGGFDFFTAAFRRELNLTGDFANVLEITDNRLTGRTLGTIVNRERKAAILANLASEHNVPREEILAIGDGANDIDMVRAAGIGVAFCAKSALVAEAPVAVFERDMRLILPLIQT